MTRNSGLFFLNPVFPVSSISFATHQVNSRFLPSFSVRDKAHPPSRAVSFTIKNSALTSPNTRRAMEEFSKKTPFGDEIIFRLQPSTSSSDSSSYNPTALLCGWIGSSHKNVSKYSAIYHKMGYNTVQLITPATLVFSIDPRRTGHYLLHVLRQIIPDERLFRGGLVIMVFSNGGACLMPHLHMMLNGIHPGVSPEDQKFVQALKPSLSAIVFDSSPCYLHVHIGVRAICEALRIRSVILWAMIYVCFFLMALIQTVFVVHLPTFYWNALRSANYFCPELYLYSTVDRLLDPVHLDALVKERKEMGREVHVFRVEDADHVLLLRKHRTEYIERLKEVNEWGVNTNRKKNGLQDWCIEAEIE